MIAEAQSPLAAWGAVIRPISSAIRASEDCILLTRNNHKDVDGNSKFIWNRTSVTGPNCGVEPISVFADTV